MEPENYSKYISTAAYVLPIGWIVAMVMRKAGRDDSEFTTFHMRQGLGLSIIELLCWVLIHKLIDNIPLDSFVLIVLVYMAWVGIRGTGKGIMRYQPFLGRWFDEKFTFIK